MAVECPSIGIQVRRVRGRAHVRASSQADEQVKETHESEKEVRMSRQFLTSTSVLGIVTAAALLAPAPAASQSASSPAKTTVGAGTWTTPRTADGQPDLQGVWDYRTITPMQRPPALASKAFFTDEEAAAFEREENRRLNRD